MHATSVVDASWTETSPLSKIS